MTIEAGWEEMAWYRLLAHVQPFQENRLRLKIVGKTVHIRYILYHRKMQPFASYQLCDNNRYEGEDDF